MLLKRENCPRSDARGVNGTCMKNDGRGVRGTVSGTRRNSIKLVGADRGTEGTRREENEKRGGNPEEYSERLEKRKRSGC